jgi:hypothetical protein
MTNLEIRKHAARLAAEHSTHNWDVEPDEAWRGWSAETGVHDAGARLLFEYEYESCRRQSLGWQWLSAASSAVAWRRILDLGRSVVGAR